MHNSNGKNIIYYTYHQYNISIDSQSAIDFDNFALQYQKSKTIFCDLNWALRLFYNNNNNTWRK